MIFSFEILVIYIVKLFHVFNLLLQSEATIKHAGQPLHSLQ